MGWGERGPAPRWRESQQRNRPWTRRERSLLWTALVTAGVAAAAISAWLSDGPSPPDASVPSVAAAPQAPPSLEVLFALPPVSPGALNAPVDGLRVDWTLDRELTDAVVRILERARVDLGHVVVLDPSNGRLLAYVSTDVERFPPTRNYPAASLVKVVTAAAALHQDPEVVHETCRFTGNPWRLTRSRVDPPKGGTEVSLRRALATSNNQCFAQLAVHRLGSAALVDAIAHFGWLAPPAPGHDPGEVTPSDDPLALGKLGSGLDGTRITPLHAAQLAGILAHGELHEPYWVERIRTPDGARLALPRRPPARRVLTQELAAELRGMLVDTTTRGTAPSAFRNRYGRPRLDDVRIAGKTGSLNGHDPDGRYEWFAGVGPADEPTVAVAVLLVQGHLWWRSAAQVAADVLHEVFCIRSHCSADKARRYLDPGPIDPVLRVGG